MQESVSPKNWPMRLGLVRYLNARPLDFAFQTNLKRPSLTCHPDTPARLAQQLLSGELDAALISSVECFRNADRLNWCKTVGVASETEVQSLLYVRREEDDLSAPVKTLYLDEGSRTTVALIQLLYLQQFGHLPDCISLHPEEIPSRLGGDSAGLLIGDAALALFQAPDGFHFRDLVTWWRSLTGLPFVAALWTYPKEKSSLFEKDAGLGHLPEGGASEDSSSEGGESHSGFFEEALEAGLDQMEDIIAIYGEQYRHYLTVALHYRLSAADQQGLALFSSLLREKGLL